MSERRDLEPPHRRSALWRRLGPILSFLDRWGFTLVMAACGLVLLGIGISKSRGHEASADWPSTTGTVVGSEVGEIRPPRDLDDPKEIGTQRTVYAADVEYTYDVDGQLQRGDRISYVREPGAATRARAEKIVARYPVGRSVEVFYDPQEPGRSVLERAEREPSKTFHVLGIAFLLVALALAGVALRRGRSG